MIDQPIKSFQAFLRGKEYDGADGFLLQVCLCDVLCQLQDYFSI